MATKIHAFTLSKKKSSFIYWKKQPLPHQKTNCSSCPEIKKIKSREDSSIPTLPGTATEFQGWSHTLSFISCNSLN